MAVEEAELLGRVVAGKRFPVGVIAAAVPIATVVIAVITAIVAVVAIIVADVKKLKAMQGRFASAFFV